MLYICLPIKPKMGAYHSNISTSRNKQNYQKRQISNPQKSNKIRNQYTYIFDVRADDSRSLIIKSHFMYYTDAKVKLALAEG